MFLWILVVINLNGGEPAQIFMENEQICRDAAAAISAPYNGSYRAAGVCVYTGMADE